MFIKVLKSFATPKRYYKPGNVYDIDDKAGKEWIAKGKAEISADPPDWVDRFLDERFYKGEGKPCLFLPHLGEFGHQVMMQLRLVHFHGASHKVVCCRAGDEVLFPSADEFVTDWKDPIKDAQRIGSNRQYTEWPNIIKRYPHHVPIQTGNMTPLQELIPLQADERIPFEPKRRQLKADIILGIRRRDFAPERNFEHWQTIADYMIAEGYTVGVVGRRPTTGDVKAQLFHTGDYDTDATIEALQNCKCYIGTDTGLSHLAATIGCKMIVFRCEDGSRNLIPRMEQVNPGQIWHVPHGWENPKAAANAAWNFIQDPTYSDEGTNQPIKTDDHDDRSRSNDGNAHRSRRRRSRGATTIGERTATQ